MHLDNHQITQSNIARLAKLIQFWNATDSHFIIIWCYRLAMWKLLALSTAEIQLNNATCNTLSD